MIDARAVLAVAAVALCLDVGAGALGAGRPIDTSRAQIAEFTRVIASYDAQAGAAAQEHNRARDRLDGIRARQRVTHGEIRRTKVLLTARQELLAQRLMGLYVAGEPRLIDFVLETGSISGLAAVDDLLARVARSDQTTIETIRERRGELDGLRRRLAGDSRRATREVAVIAGRQERLRNLLSRRQRALVGARAQLGTQLRAEKRRLARLAAEKRVSATAVAPPTAPIPTSFARDGATLPGGAHVFPLAGASTFGDDWLAPRAGGRYHEGIDLFAARGTPVVAVADGTLFRVGYSGISGYRLWLRDAAGTEFFYAHLDGYAPTAREGASVNKGSVLGYNGDSGDAKGTSPHVHFQVHPDGGGPVRPYPIVSAWPRVG